MKITLRLTPEQLAVISDGLLLVAYGRAAPVVQDINMQLAAQREADKSDHDLLTAEMMLSK